MIEPSKVSVAAKKRENENVKFRTFLKCNADAAELDRQFLELHNELFAGYDCCKCNNCCREYSTMLQDGEVDSIAAFLGLTSQEFTEKHLSQSAEGYEIKAPCCFLRACLESFKKDSNEGENDHLTRVVQLPFTVFPKSASFVKPSKGPLNNPSPW